MLKEFYCTSCGGTDLTADAYCSCKWNVEEQKFVLHSEHRSENDYCNDCSEHVHADFREVTDVKTLAKIEEVQ